MKFITTDGRHYKRIDRDFYGNQHVIISRKRRLRKKSIVPTIKAFFALTVFSTIVIWKGILVADAYFNPPVISPLASSQTFSKASQHIPRKIIVSHPQSITIPLPSKTPARTQITAISIAPVPPTTDQRITKLHDFLLTRHSPLADYAKEIVTLADGNAIDYTLVSAIAGKESGFGLAINPDSYNAWGVMTWDEKGKRSLRKFSSWEEGIVYETNLLAKDYRENSNEAIGAKYCPKSECSETWAKDVTSFSLAINQN